MTLHIDTAFMLWLSIAAVAATIMWLLLRGAVAETREWDRLGREADYARHGHTRMGHVPMPPVVTHHAPPHTVVYVVPAGGDTDAAVRQITNALPRGGAL